jgi:hypothetical protein
VNYRNRKLLDLAYELPCMLQLPCCEGGVGEPAHSNQSKHGKGGAMKAHDCFFVPGCRSCHRELDQGRTMSRDEKRQVWDEAFLRTYVALWEQGLIKVAK